MAWVKRSGIMLCQPLDEHNLERNWKVSPYLLVQPKLDGHRCWIRWEDNEPHLISSQGNEITSCPHINMALRELRTIYGQEPQLDGELYVHLLGFEEISSRVARRDYDSKSLEIQFHVFDCKEDVANGERILHLVKMFELWREEASLELKEVIQFVPTHIVENNEEIDNYLEEFLETGYEGIIVRNPLAYYTERRPFTILKWKPGKEDEYIVVACNQAISSHGEPMGLLGSLTCRDDYGNEFNVGCGANISMSDKFNYWKNNHLLIGNKAVVQYQNLTKNGVPRFGKFTTVLIDLEEIL